MHEEELNKLINQTIKLCKEDDLDFKDIKSV
jgi:hypothetical protein